jgi:hypothetical protein
MQPEIFDPGGCDGLWKGFLGPPTVMASDAVGEDQGYPGQGSWPSAKDRADRGSHGYVTAIPILGPGNGQDAGLEIHVSPAKAEKLALAATGLEEDQETLAVFIRRELL